MPFNGVEQLSANLIEIASERGFHDFKIECCKKRKPRSIAYLVNTRTLLCECPCPMSGPRACDLFVYRAATDGPGPEYGWRSLS